jgi:cardiolipin synthase
VTSAPAPSGGGIGDGPPSAEEPPPAADRILTIPNLLSTLRLVGVPVFLWVALGPRADWVALGILMFAGISDYLDGRLARALNQTSRLGALLDPLADRLYILATIVALTVRGNIPWWLTAIIIGRDVFLTLLLVPMRGLGLGTALPVHYLGKAATFNLLYAFPLLLLVDGHGWLSTVVRPLGWAFAIWGAALYWWAGLLYAFQVAGIARDRRRRASGGRPYPAGGSP